MLLSRFFLKKTLWIQILLLSLCFLRLPNALSFIQDLSNIFLVLSLFENKQEELLF